MANYNKAFEPVGSTITFTQGGWDNAFDPGTAANGWGPTGTAATGMHMVCAQITDISMNLETSDIDISHFGSVDYKEYKASALKDGGELSATVQFDPDIDLAEIMGQKVIITVTFKDGFGNTEGAWTFDGYLKSYSFTGAIGSAMTANISFKASGEITLAA
jgi:uncharacterized protein (DUF2237 family)